MLRWLMKLIGLIKKGWLFITGLVRRFDRRMRNQYRPAHLALAALGVLAVIMTVILLLPPYLGLSNDGSLDSVMADVGLAPFDPDAEDPYFSYYDRLYLIAPDGWTPNTTPHLLEGTIRFAIWLDEVITGQDGVFDIRVLAAIYMVLYLVVLFPMFRGVLSRVRMYSEGLTLAIVSVVIFGDMTIVVRFASFYTQPWELILLILLVDAAFLIPWKKDAWLPQVSILAACWLLMELNNYYALASIVFSMAYWLLMRRKTDVIHRTAYLIAAVLLCFISVVNGTHMLETQTKVEKHDQMTRGVLFQADNPEEALEFFGIEPRYSVLTDNYAAQSFPAADIYSGVLDEGFLDQYDTGEVALYYITHPLDLVSLFDVGAHSAFITRSDFSGNYERSMGLPPRAKSPMMSIWSTFKEQSAPKTAGLFLLLGAALIFFRRGSKDDTPEGEAEKVFTMMCLLLIVFAIAQLLTVLIMSGDSLLVRQSFMMSVFIDILVVLFLSEVLHKLKIIDVDKE